MAKSIPILVGSLIACFVMNATVLAKEVQDTGLTDAALVGTWVVDEGKCSDANAEFLGFSSNGAVQSTRNGGADAVGFWKLEGGKIHLTVLAPPARLDEKLKDVQGYYTFDITIAPYAVTPGSFQGVVILGEQIRYGRFTRCG